MRRRISEIVDELKGVISLCDLNIDDGKIFSEAMTTYRGEQLGKSNSPIKNHQSNDSPSQKQIDFIKKNKKSFESKGFDLSNVRTKSQATQIIKEFIALKNPPKENSHNEDLYDEDSQFL